MSPKKPAFLDWNSGAPLSPSVREALSLLPALFNPSSSHSFGRESKKVIREAEEQVRLSLGDVSSYSLSWTSSGTESNQSAVRWNFEEALRKEQGFLWITSSAEHDSFSTMIPWLKARGARVEVLPVDSSGQISLRALEQALQNKQPGEAALVSVIWASNETGVIQPVNEMEALARTYGVPLHLDGAQVWGKLRSPLIGVRPDWVSFSAQKIGAPAGTGVLLYQRHLPFRNPLFIGESIRPGTENTLGIHLTGVAAKELRERSHSEFVELAKIRDRLETRLMELFPGARVNGHSVARLPNTTSFTLPGDQKVDWVALLDLDGVAISRGSACSSGLERPSHVLEAMGLSSMDAWNTIRISIGWTTQEEDLDVLLQSLKKHSMISRYRESHELRSKLVPSEKTENSSDRSS